MIKQMKLGFTCQEKEREILIDVIYSDRRTLGLEVGQDGAVKVRVPKKTPDRQIRNLVQEKRQWIIEKYLIMEARQKTDPNRGELEPSLEKKYRKLARERIEERAVYFSEKMGVDYKRISIRAAKTRWGSCSLAGNLNFHWKLILMPPQILDYVVVHELAHRKEMNHSPAFWAEVEKILPDYRERRKWLKQQGQRV